MNTGSPVEQSANQKKVLIKLKNDKIIYLDKEIANIAKYFDNTSQPNLLTKEELETGIQFKAFDDNIVKLTSFMLKVIYALDQNQALEENQKNEILRNKLNCMLAHPDQAHFDIIQAWRFADYLGIPQLESAFYAGVGRKYLYARISCNIPRQ